MPIDIAEEYYNKDVYYLLESMVGEKCIFDRYGVYMYRCECWGGCRCGCGCGYECGGGEG